MMYELGLAAAVFFAALLAQPAMAQPIGTQADDDMVACRQIDDDDERLQSFDAATDARYGVNEELRERRESGNAAFGLPSDQFGNPLPELKAIVSLVDDDMRCGAVTLQLDNGAGMAYHRGGSALAFFTVLVPLDPRRKRPNGRSSHSGFRTQASAWPHGPDPWT